MDIEGASQTYHPERHGVLWLPDGNVVLATDSLLFRVHKSVLSLHSSVFKDMFDLPFTPAGNLDGNARQQLSATAAVTSCEEYEGLPMVSLAGDKGKEVAHLLLAAYDRGYYEQDNDNTPLEVVTALLLLSSKYDFANIRRHVIKHISRHYPITLPEYEALDGSSARIFGRARWECHFDLLRAAFKAQADILLPGLYYACSTFTTHQILEKTYFLDMICLKSLLVGKESLGSSIRTVMFMILRDSSSRNCSSPHGGCKFNASRILSFGNVFDTMDINDFKGRTVAEECLENFCQPCLEFITARTNEYRQVLWESLPGRFNLPSWSVLKTGT